MSVTARSIISTCCVIPAGGKAGRRRSLIERSKNRLQMLVDARFLVCAVTIPGSPGRQRESDAPRFTLHAPYQVTIPGSPGRQREAGKFQGLIVWQTKASQYPARRDDSERWRRNRGSTSPLGAVTIPGSPGRQREAHRRSLARAVVGAVVGYWMVEVMG